MLKVIIITLILAIFNPFHWNIQPAFHLPFSPVMLMETSLMISLADQQTGLLRECCNKGSLELGTVIKKGFKYVLVHIFLFIVRYFFVVYNVSSKLYGNTYRGFTGSIFRCQLVWFSCMKKWECSLANLKTFLIVQSAVQYFHRQMHPYFLSFVLLHNLLLIYSDFAVLS